MRAYPLRERIRRQRRNKSIPSRDMSGRELYSDSRGLARNAKMLTRVARKKSTMEEKRSTLRINSCLLLSSPRDIGSIILFRNFIVKVKGKPGIDKSMPGLILLLSRPRRTGAHHSSYEKRHGVSVTCFLVGEDFLHKLIHAILCGCTARFGIFC